MPEEFFEHGSAAGTGGMRLTTTNLPPWNDANIERLTRLLGDVHPDADLRDYSVEVRAGEGRMSWMIPSKGRSNWTTHWTRKRSARPRCPGGNFCLWSSRRLDARINVVQPAVAPGPEGSIFLSQKLPTVSMT